KRDVVAVALERDPNSPLARAGAPSRFFVELRGAGALGPLGLGGQQDDGCTGGCSKGLTVGFLGMLGAGYELGASGLGFAIDAGYLWVRRAVTARPDTLVPTPFGQSPADPGTTDDVVALRGLAAGLAAQIHRGATITWLARLG